VVNKETGIINKLIQEVLREHQEQETTSITDEQLRELVREAQAQQEEDNRAFNKYLNRIYPEEVIGEYIAKEDISTLVPGTLDIFETPSNLDRDINLENTLADYFDFQENSD
jgi:hypothetical protein